MIQPGGLSSLSGKGYLSLNQITGAPMSFFTKMKDRLFKSQSKLDEGLENLVAEGDEVV